MFKLLLLGLGIMLLIEGIIYGLFSGQMKKMMKLLITLEDKKIKNAGYIFALIGFCLIYIIIKFY